MVLCFWLFFFKCSSYDHFYLFSFHLYLGTIARQPTPVWSNRSSLIRPDLINVCNWASLVIGTNKHLACSWLLAPALTTPLPPRGEASLCWGLLGQARLKGVHKTVSDFMTHNMQCFICRQGLGYEFSGLLPSHAVSKNIFESLKHNTPFIYLIVVLSRRFVLLVVYFWRFRYFCCHVSAICFQTWLVRTLCQ